MRNYNFISILIVSFFTVHSWAQIQQRDLIIDPDDPNACPSGTTRYYYDGDNDGYGDINGFSNCFSSQPINYTRRVGDCDDSDPTVTFKRYYYHDSDGDGFGDPNNRIYSCSAPSGYVSNNDDECPSESGPDNGCSPTAIYSNENYVLERTFKQPTTSGGYTQDLNLATEKITYFDGIGNPTQRISIQASPAKDDIISEYQYKNGSLWRSYLPYPEDDNNHGEFRINFIGQNSKSYYNDNFPEDFTGVSVSGTNSYEEFIFDGSGNNKLSKKSDPGKAWKNGNNREQRYEYKLNGTSDNIRKFSVNLDGQGNPTLESNGYYTSNSLEKTISRNEEYITSQGDRHSVVKFRNMKGDVVLQREINGANILDTYYVYSELGNLQYILTPKMNASSATVSVLLSKINALGYEYKYDQRDRIIAKSLPGKDWEYFVYNALDKPVLSQTKRLRDQNKWLFIKYDALSRPIYEGYIINTKNREELQNIFNNASVEFETATSTAQSIGGASVYYTNLAKPVNISQVNMIYYYDDYTAFNTNSHLENEGTFILGQVVDHSVNGLPTGVKVRILDQTNKWKTTINHYDKDERLIHSVNINDYLLTIDKESIAYSFDGKITEKQQYHKKGNQPSINIKHELTYDHSNRLKDYYHTINGKRSFLFQNFFNELGKLERKKIGNSHLAPLQTYDYSYNVRGWLTSINDINSLGSDVYALEFSYNNPASTAAVPKYNGNISQIRWRSKGNDNSIKSYVYYYDDIDQIKSADFSNSSYNLVNVDYDKNGNITALQRNNPEGANDNFIYNYSGNTLQSISGSQNENFSYDDGDMTKNSMRDIESIRYNDYGFPDRIEMDNGSIVNYIYDAQGHRISKSTSGTTTDYAGDFVYQNDQLQFFSQPEGYIFKDSSGFNYVFEFKDHLENTRISFMDVNQNSTSSSSLVSFNETNYYPFGKEHVGYNDINTTYGNSKAGSFKFNSTEFNEGTELYEMDYRFYDPQLSRFLASDPMAEEASHLTPYRFGFNNPVLFSDPTGLWETTAYGWVTSDIQEIKRLLAYINANGNDISASGVSNFIKEDIAFMKSVDKTFILSTVYVENSAITEFSKLRYRNEISYSFGMTDYLYTESDYRMRNKILADGGTDPISYELLRREKTGWFQPITAKNYISYRGSEKVVRLEAFAMWSDMISSVSGGPKSISRNVKARYFGNGYRNYIPASLHGSFNAKGELKYNFKKMSWKTYRQKFSKYYRGKFKGSGNYMKFMSMDFKLLKYGIYGK
ncbi:MAG: RHS repeat-associated core domain-containing protein [Salegentibacter mishustinae]|nr:RHS repeat-associated core domain-containing protein [Salegentibacter mishustinae]